MSIVGQTLTGAFIYDLGEGTEWTPSKFIDSTKVRRVADIQEAHGTSQTSVGWRSGMT